MTNATITRPEWSTVIDPVLQKELEQHVLVAGATQIDSNQRLIYTSA